MVDINQQFPKQERLCSKRIITAIFSGKQKIAEHPLQLYFLSTDLLTNSPFQVVFSVPKRRFKSAVDRNHLKRLLREAFRRHKQPIMEQLVSSNKQLAMFFVYASNRPLNYQDIEDKIKLLLLRLAKQLDQHSTS